MNVYVETNRVLRLLSGVNERVLGFETKAFEKMLPNIFSRDPLLNYIWELSTKERILAKAMSCSRLESSETLLDLVRQYKETSVLLEDSGFCEIHKLYLCCSIITDIALELKNKRREKFLNKNFGALFSMVACNNTN